MLMFYNLKIMKSILLDIKSDGRDIKNVYLRNVKQNDISISDDFLLLKWHILNFVEEAPCIFLLTTEEEFAII